MGFNIFIFEEPGATEVALQHLFLLMSSLVNFSISIGHELLWAESALVLFVVSMNLDVGGKAILKLHNFATVLEWALVAQGAAQ